MGIGNDNGKLLKQARTAKGLTQEQLGEMLDPQMNKQGIYKLETGRHRITAAVAAQLADILGLKPADLADEAFIVSPKKRGKNGTVTTRNLPLLGKAQAGYWSEAEMNIFGFDLDTGESDVPTIPVVAIEAYPEAQQYAVQLVGPSLNKVAPEGSCVVCVRLEAFPCDPEMKALDGKLVHVERERGDLVETTVKRLRFTANTPQLWPESHDPKHQTPIPLADGKAATTVQIVGVVIGLFQHV